MLRPFHPSAVDGAIFFAVVCDWLPGDLPGGSDEQSMLTRLQATIGNMSSSWTICRAASATVSCRLGQMCSVFARGHYCNNVLVCIGTTPAHFYRFNMFVGIVYWVYIVNVCVFTSFMLRSCCRCPNHLRWLLSLWSGSTLLWGAHPLSQAESSQPI